MKPRCKLIRPALWTAVFVLSFAVVLPGPPGATEAGPPASQMAREFWRPTRVQAGTEFAGHEACAGCHKSRVAVQQQSAMGRALEPVAAARVLRARPRLEFRFGRFAWEIARKGNESLYAVTDGKEKVTARVAYAFGQGKSGQTYVLEHEGAFYESRVSFYNAIQGLDFTLGHPRTEPDSLTAALGKRMSRDETLQCFSCHSTGTVIGTGLHLERMIPGVSCEACHGPGGNHMAAAKAGLPCRDRIFNPARLNADDMAQEFCGACHRSAMEIFARPNQDGLNNVRFQPYRVFKSKCYSDDPRIKCTVCHDPHNSVEHDAAYYDLKCLACHSPTRGTTPVSPASASSEASSAPSCKIESKKCATCHMPKVELPGAHFGFTDHRIRVVRPGEPYPY